MSVPEFYYFIRPALEVVQENPGVHRKQVEVLVGEKLKLNEEQLNEILPSGRRRRVWDRTNWALTYLRQARLIEIVGRGLSKITARGEAYLLDGPKIIKPIDLRQFPEFIEFAEGQRESIVTSTEVAKLDEDSTPEELMEQSYTQLRSALAADLIDRIKKMPPDFFENLIVDLMLKLGYGGAVEDAGRAIGKSGDGGVDGVIKQDKLGLEKIYLQAKRLSDATVGRKEIQAFVGALVGQGANKGVFITTSSFTAEAKSYAEGNHNFKLSLVDGIELARLMIDHDLGVSHVRRYEIKRIDSDFFATE